MSRKRCAIYTRKSSEEGLDQSFNSLDAQREACEAYVRSQVGEGWKALPAKYDDGGFSGGSMERPALDRLLADIRAGKIDIVVVYKVDRLTRSLADFAKIVEVMDKAGASFVSVTQAFNTTTSMGRLTLNVLLSFAQFEREVTGERIRDKIAASKAKGMWMGGNLPLGYDCEDRKLVPNQPEADTVRTIFELYLELGSVPALCAELNRRGVSSKQRMAKAGHIVGGGPFARGALFHLLRNRVYLGEIVHRDKSYPGLHEPIIAPELFQAVQTALDDNVRRHKAKAQASPSRLVGRIVDARGRPMSPSHTKNRHGATFRYYAAVQASRGEKPARISAPLIEDFVLERLRVLAGASMAAWEDLAVHLIKVELMPDGVAIEVRTSIARDWEDRLGPDDVLEPAPEAALRLVPGQKPEVRGGRTWLKAAGERVRPDRALIRALRRSHEILRENGLMPVAGRGGLPMGRGVADPYQRKLAELAFLAPDIQHAIMHGRQPLGLTLHQLLDIDLPIEWSEQRRVLDFDRS
ncbi:MAG TPA: recombinase family protein [Phenylobacterium sp.]|uniref:recombinase family protein n=1 Tax=Phenylobacterium sp. TaxID=1871053 RepID=UPI002F9393B3